MQRADVSCIETSFVHRGIGCVCVCVCVCLRVFWHKKGFFTLLRLTFDMSSAVQSCVMSIGLSPHCEFLALFVLFVRVRCLFACRLSWRLCCGTRQRPSQCMGLSKQHSVPAGTFSLACGIALRRTRVSFMHLLAFGCLWHVHVDDFMHTATVSDFAQERYRNASERQGWASF